VGPVWRGGSRNEPQLLASCYCNSLRLALGNGVRSIAFPAISCGAYGYPLEQATEIAVRETRRFLDEHDGIDRVIFACFGDDVASAYRSALERRDKG
jgi:O-acetyl-ADP-ribose deacetylase (regulator of RNase III)